jgi:cell wall-associated NlpC family hydrolase
VTPLATPDDDFLTSSPGKQRASNIVPGTTMARLSALMGRARPDGSFDDDVEFYDPAATVSDAGRGVANPYGSGLEAYEPNTVFFGQDVYAQAYADSQQSKLEEAAQAQLLTGDFSPGGNSEVAGVPYASVFNEAGKKYGIAPATLAAIARAESNFNPRARSGAGAQGLMQFMPGTASGLGVDPWDPRSAIFGAAKYLKQQLDKFGTLDLALAAYNAGPGNVSKYGGIPPFTETQAYVRRVRAFTQDYGSGPLAAPGDTNFSDGGVADATGRVSRMVSAAMGLAARGVPYVWGGTSASGVDCSGLIYYAARAAGIDWQRYRAVDYGQMGKAVSLSQARPGDIVYYDNPGDVDHVGIYLGNGRMVQAPQSGQNVKVTGVGNYSSIRRVFNDGAFATSSTSYGAPRPTYNGNAYDDPYAAVRAYTFTGYGALGLAASSYTADRRPPTNRYLSAAAAQQQRARNFTA